MAYKALYRTYRPQSFEEVAGQEHIILTLKNAVRKEKIAHAYLFCGPRGTGKTSIAKLLAKAINCVDLEHAPCGKCENCIEIQTGNHPDIIEIDAASNNGVDEIRDLIEKVKYAPIQAKYKVYIIDEVHMLSTGAFNALLKTLEEPPTHVVFILATTEPHKVIPTIISRCQRYDFMKVETKKIVKKMQYILNKENIAYENEALEMIAELADGGMRDALSILDQCIVYSPEKISFENVKTIFGINSIDEKIMLLNYIFANNVQEIIEYIENITDKGIDIKRLTNDLVEILKETIIYSYVKNDNLMKKINIEQAQKLLNNTSKSQMLKMIDILMEALEKYRNASNISSYFEVAMLKMVEINQNDVDNRKEIKEKPKKDIIQKSQEINNSINLDSLSTSSEDECNIIIKNEEPQIKLLEISEILSLLVQGIKEIRYEDEKKILSFMDINAKFIKENSLISNCNVVASGNNFILLSAPYRELALELNSMLKDIERYFWDGLQLEKHIFIIDDKLKSDAIEKFKECLKNKQLPEPMKLDRITRYMEKIEVEEKSTLDKIKDIVGNDIEIL